MRPVDQTHVPEIGRMLTKRLWGRGRGLQLVTRHLICGTRGHLWQPWFFDWPYDVPDDPLSQRDPGVEEVLMWARGCDRFCGVIEQARTTLALSGLLPGDVLGLYENPMRRGFR
jgi:hypothetical protein